MLLDAESTPSPRAAYSAVPALSRDRGAGLPATGALDDLGLVPPADPTALRAASAAARLGGLGGAEGRDSPATADGSPSCVDVLVLAALPLPVRRLRQHAERLRRRTLAAAHKRRGGPRRGDAAVASGLVAGGNPRAGLHVVGLAPSDPGETLRRQLERHHPLRRRPLPHCAERGSDGSQQARASASSSGVAPRARRGLRRPRRDAPQRPSPRVGGAKRVGARRWRSEQLLRKPHQRRDGGARAGHRGTHLGRQCCGG
mmetsp:Transcript_52852/g.153997  ORF Transcript_52852/g.153997 Transcript_52852/m.153997 type:complete len:258 (-) Transcript_52852:231-1004(-)